MAEKEKSNLRVLSSFLLGGEHQAAGSVIPKSAFATKGDWQNIAFTGTALVEETDDPVGGPEAAVEGDEPKMPGVKKATR